MCTVESLIDLPDFSEIYVKLSWFVETAICTLYKLFIDFSCQKAVGDMKLFCLQARLSKAALQMKK